MYISHEGQRLYLRSWDYNCARVFTRLAEIVKSKGGKISPTKSAIISNRTHGDAVAEYEGKIARYTELNEKHFSPLRAEAIADYQAKLDLIKAVPNDPIRVTHIHGITFVLDECFYSFYVEDNPLFNYRYCKTPVRNNSYSADAVHEVAFREWCVDALWRIDCPDAIVETAANRILDYLLNATPSYIRRDETRKRVPNTYNDGCHYEIVLKPERFESVEGWC